MRNAEQTVIKKIILQWAYNNNSKFLNKGKGRDSVVNCLVYLLKKNNNKIVEYLDIVYEDKNIILINKPPGLAIHQGIRTQKTLIDLLVGYYPRIKNVGDDKMRPGIVHRLDKDTSGLMVIAKNNRAFYFLKKQFMDRKVEKKYIALVRGRVRDKKGIIKGGIGRFKDKQVVENHETRIMNYKLRFKEAITEYKVLKLFKDYTLCEVWPKTGRMHQIRVHFKSIGHPVAGDKKYAFRRRKDIIEFPRQFLHANYLRFALPYGKIMAFEADLPNDLQNILSDLESNALKW